MLTLCLAAGPAAAVDPIAAQIAAQLPGWTVAQMAKGDLNGDSLADVAVTLRRPGPGAEGAPAKVMLAIFLAGPGGTLRLHTKAAKAVCIDCGGAKGPFDEVLGTPSINTKGILGITYQGGSRETWTVFLKWRYDAKANRFLLIGETRDYADTLADDGEIEPGEVSAEDINYLSGKMIRTISKGGTQHCRVKPAWRAINLARFDFEGSSGDDRFVEDSCK
jgi:hypothetical protein